ARGSAAVGQHQLGTARGGRRADTMSDLASIANLIKVSSRAEHEHAFAQLRLKGANSGVVAGDGVGMKTRDVGGVDCRDLLSQTLRCPTPTGTQNQSNIVLAHAGAIGNNF